MHQAEAMARFRLMCAPFRGILGMTHAINRSQLLEDGQCMRFGQQPPRCGQRRLLEDEAQYPPLRPDPRAV